MQMPAGFSSLSPLSHFPNCRKYWSSRSGQVDLAETDENENENERGNENEKGNGRQEVKMWYRSTIL